MLRYKHKYIYIYVYIHIYIYTYIYIYMSIFETAGAILRNMREKNPLRVGLGPGPPEPRQAMSRRLHTVRDGPTITLRIEFFPPP